MADRTTPLRLAFMGTPDFALPALETLIASPHEIVAVYTQPPRPAGRGHNEKKTPVHLAAEAAGFEVLTPKSLKSAEEQDLFRSLQLDAAVVVAYGLILPKAILTEPRFGCLNIHPSLLPRWRGAAPIQRAILAGDDETGVAIMRLDEGLDSGPILATETVPIDPTATAGALHDDLAQRGARLLLRVLDGLTAGVVQAAPQTGIGVTYAAKIGPHDQRIDWRKGAAETERQIRALSPVPGAWFEFAGARVKLWSAVVTEGNGKPGEVIDSDLTVACGSGALRPLTLQRQGKKAMSAGEFLRGNPVSKGTILS
jgi:methionyl-tRNA formyltransferase